MVNPAGLVLVLVGLPFVLWPYEVARISEMLDAIGSRRSIYDVQPAGWNVTLQRVLGVGMVLYGLVMFLSG